MGDENSSNDDDKSFIWTDYPEVGVCLVFVGGVICLGFFRPRGSGRVSPRWARMRRTTSFVRMVGRAANDGSVELCAIVGRNCVHFYYTYVASHTSRAKSHREHFKNQSSSSPLRCCCPNHQGLYIAYRCTNRIARGMCNDIGACSRICTYYSFVGILFMGWVGLMVKYQPFFVGGLEDYDKCKDSAFGAMGMFVFTFFVSLIILCNDSMKKRREILSSSASSGAQRSGQGIYNQVPPIEGLQEYAVDMELPSSLTPSDDLQNRSPYRDNPNSSGYSDSGSGGPRVPYRDDPYGEDEEGAFT